MRKTILAVLLSLAATSTYAGDITRMSVDLVEDNAQVLVRNAQPSFGWALEGFGRNTRQKAYEIELTEAASGTTVWNSGKVKGCQSTGIKSGASLKASAGYNWKVTVWTNHGKKTSDKASFRTAEVQDGIPPRYSLVKDKQEPVLAKYCDDGTVFVDFGKDAYSQICFTYTSDRDFVAKVHLGEAAKDGRLNRKPGGTIRYCNYEIDVKEGTNDYKIEYTPDNRNTTIVEGRDYNPVLMPAEIGEVYPFRYVEIENMSAIPEKITRYVVHYPFDDRASDFVCSNDTLNMVWDLCKYSMKATSALGVYIDGDRERIPYEADAIINQLGHYYTDNDRTLARYSIDYLVDNATWPTEWILQNLIMLWNDYMFTGDKGLLEKRYKNLKAKTLFDLRDSDGLVSTQTGKQTPELMKKIGYKGKNIRDIVDWPQSGATGLDKEAPGEADGFVFSPYNAVVNAYHYKAVCLMADIAEALGNEEDKEYYEGAARKTFDAFNNSFFDKETGTYRDGKDIKHSSLHTNMFALDFGLVPEENLSSVASFIKSRGMACSVYGAQFLLEALYKAGEGDYAYKLLSSTGLRSWYNMIRVGSTITLEAWDPVFKPNLDWNHAWGAAPASIIPMGLMGVKPLKAGWEEFEVRPQLGGLSEAEALIPTIKGEIKCKVSRGVRNSLDISIPENTKATIVLPGKKPFKKGSGSYSFNF